MNELIVQMVMENRIDQIDSINLKVIFFFWIYVLIIF